MFYLAAIISCLKGETIPCALTVSPWFALIYAIHLVSKDILAGDLNIIQLVITQFVQFSLKVLFCCFTPTCSLLHLVSGDL